MYKINLLTVDIITLARSHTCSLREFSGKTRHQLAQPNSAVAVMDEADIRRMVEEGISHSEIRYRLRRRHPEVRGLSERSVRRVCFEHDIHYSSGVLNRELRQIVESGVSEVNC